MNLSKYNRVITINLDHNAHVSAFFLNIHRSMMNKAAKTKERMILEVLE